MFSSFVVQVLGFNSCTSSTLGSGHELGSRKLLDLGSDPDGSLGWHTSLGVGQSRVQI